MKEIIVFLICLGVGLAANAQDENAPDPGQVQEQQLESLAEQLETETEDDSFLQSLLQFKKDRINLNTAEASDLRELKLLSDLQIDNLLRYRRLLGNFISIYELQAVPTIDLETLRKILPYVRVGNVVPLSHDVGKRFTEGAHTLLMRAQQVLEASDGFLRPDSIPNRYLGSRQRLFFRYKYTYRNLLQFGLVGDKDAGEQFFKGQQKHGFDFYSFHLFARKLGIVKLLALGDFTVNMGQGLIQWQSLAFKKSADITNIKRQADILRPYNSATEYNFQRGAGITLQKNHVEFTAFASIRNLDANLQVDSFNNANDFASSILNSGYHRTPNELAKKSTIHQTALGANISYNRTGLHVGLNAVNFSFSEPLLRDVQPYNQFAIQGKSWANGSVDYSYTYRNMHFFGEAAIDKNGSKAFLNGVMVSLDTKVDGSLVYRNIEQTYQAMYGNSFTEGTYPTNEKGLFTGLTIKPGPALRLDLYADLFTFPWLRYRVDAPTKGSEYFAQLTYKSNKRVEVYTRFKNESKAINITGLNLPTHQFFNRPRQNWRTQISYQVTREVTLKHRVELLWYDVQQKDRGEHGYLSYLDVAYKPFGNPFSVNGRLVFFETDSYDSRLYTFENDVLYSFTIPAFFDKGYRYYLNVNYDVSKKLAFWARFAQTVNPGKTSVGSGLDKIAGNSKSEIKLQFMYVL